MKPWITKALELLTASLGPPHHELNEVDWKSDLSPNKQRLCQHLSAFSNHPGGGFLVFGIDAHGVPQGIDATTTETIVNQLANLGRQGVEPPVALDHAIAEIRGQSVLLVHINEATVKPVHLRGQGIEAAYIRSGGTTREASRQEVGMLMLHSRTPRWEDLHATVVLPHAELLERLDLAALLTLLEQPAPTDDDGLMVWAGREHLVADLPAGGGYITNLGAIAAARNLGDYPDLAHKGVRVIVYAGVDKSRTVSEREGKRGYAAAFQSLVAILDGANGLLRGPETVINGLRTRAEVYPSIAVREIVANALIHQDFTVSGGGPMVEIFSDRVEVSNPGSLLPSKTLDRLIGAQPESRNEVLARLFRRCRICEERGSGLVKAGLAIEAAGLPPIRFEAGPNHVKVTLFGPRPFADMTQAERLAACYQHAVLRHSSNGVMTNASLRERLRLTERQRRTATSLIRDAIDAGLIKPADPDSASLRFSEYIPAWA
jgi:ATP-dependent DNA helicase RecG